MNYSLSILPLLLSMLCLLPSSRAQQQTNSALEDQELREAFARFRNADSLLLDSEIIGFLSSAPEEKQLMHLRYFKSKSLGVIFTASEKDLFFFNHSGQFKVLFDQKKVIYKPFSDDSVFKEYWNTYDAQSIDQTDTLLLKYAQIGQHKQNKNQMSYYLVYPQGNFKSMRVYFQKHSRILDSIQYEIASPYTATVSNSPILYHQNSRTYHIEQKVPEEVQTLMANSQDLKAYIEKHYQDYSLIIK